jgi:hypothetical protein
MLFVDTTFGAVPIGYQFLPEGSANWREKTDSYGGYSNSYGYVIFDKNSPVVIDIAKKEEEGIDGIRHSRDLYKSAFDEWHDKTQFVQEWVNEGKLSGRGSYGKHRADILRELAEEALVSRTYRQAIDDALVVRHLGVAGGNPKEELGKILNWEVDVNLDPTVSEQAQALIDRGLAEANKIDDYQDVFKEIKEMAKDLRVSERSALKFFMPRWAVDVNRSYEVVVGAQLCTKDGRRMGNAHVISKAHKFEDDYFMVLTDAGNKVNMTEKEIRSTFHISPWISDVEEVVRKFEREPKYYPI